MLVLYFCLLLSCAGFVCHGSNLPITEYTQEKMEWYLAKKLEFKLELLQKKDSGATISLTSDQMYWQDFFNYGDELLKEGNFEIFSSQVSQSMAISESVRKTVQKIQSRDQACVAETELVTTSKKAVHN